MNNWCITRGMSWDAVQSICRKYKISFEELPVAGNNFWYELLKVRRDISEAERKSILNSYRK